MIDIWLVRHGEAAASWHQDTDPGLSPLGRQQALRAANDLMLKLDRQVVQIVASPKQRTLETAAPFVALQNTELLIDPRFIEIQAPVPLAQRSEWLTAFMKECWSEQSQDQWRWREGIVNALQELTTTSVIFTHFLVINTVIAHCESRAETLSTWPANGSLFHFQLDAGKLKLVESGEQIKTVVN